MSVTSTDHLKEGGANDRLYDVVRPGIESNDVMKIYDQWADTYDKDVLSVDYNPPKIGAAEFLNRYPNNPGIYILDCAAGTGLVGMELSKRGFTNMDALDASDEMLRKAKEKGIYQNFIQAFLGPNKLDIKDDAYDALISVGCFCQGHVDHQCLTEMIRVVKPGGKIVLSLRERFLIDVVVLRDNLEKTMQLHHDNGLWKWIKREVVHDYHDKDNGVIYVFEVL